MFELGDEWCLYGHFSSNSLSYKSAYQHILDVGTCSEWGSMIKFVPTPKDFIGKILMLNGNRIIAFSFFKRIITPEWEHILNSKGCTITCRPSISDLEHGIWVDIVCDVARGGVFPMSIAGIQISTKGGKCRPFFKLDVWFVDNKHEKYVDLMNSWAKEKWNLKFTQSQRNMC